jgi:hypothetical protein
MFFTLVKKMKRIALITCLAGLSVLSAMSFAGDKTKTVLDIGYGRPPVNAFCLVTPRTTTQLVNQVKSNPTVLDRYRRHFAMSDSEVISFLGDLKPGRLVRDSIYSVYGVPGNGQFHFKRRLLKKGTYVFMNNDGRAILQMICGNPLTLGPNNPIALSESAQPADVLAVARGEDGEMDSGAIAMTDLNTSTTTAPSTPALISTISSSSGSRPINIVGGGIIPLLAGGGILLGKRGGGGGDSVPEPASMAALALGFGALAAKKRKN